MDKPPRALVVALSAAVAGLANAQAIERPQWRVGDSWTYVDSYLSSTDFHGKIESRQVVTVKNVNSEGYEVAIDTFDPSGALLDNWQGHSSVNARPITRANANGTWEESRGIVWPLEAGKNRRFEGKQGDGASFVNETSVGGWEEIAVPAGKFNALRIVKNFYKGAYASRETWWYSPDVKRHVRYEFVSSYLRYEKEHTVSELWAFHLNP